MQGAIDYVREIQFEIEIDKNDLGPVLGRGYAKKEFDGE